MKKILVVDDYEELLHMFTMLLTINGYETQTASSKDKLLNGLSDFEPDLILLDVVLNGANGRDLCRDIKTRCLPKKVGVILVSAYPDLLKNYEECDADEVIEKPFSIQEVIDKINKVLSSNNVLS